ncbi:hypothetical protein [Heyndrickxia vini]|uniref:Uncharacterized protein n=1 Tax=Heyndrickxia vini TaxID=1476025 RepID=A0ABX7E3C3_9BACI|nr:hypothetical protein [Heyndrickxia vini]QQZ09785.1 hypothetical protein I5776_02055 [Heyndrickxia vini]
MITRKEKHIPKKGKLKLLIGVLFLSLMIGSSISVAFADQDIPTLLTNWFNKKGSESITSIEQAIMSEKETQKERLKEELQVELRRSQQALTDYALQERKDRISEIRAYTDQLISTIHIDNQQEKEAISEKLKTIMNGAIQEMNGVTSEKQTANPDDSSKTDKKVKDDSSTSEENKSNVEEGEQP